MPTLHLLSGGAAQGLVRQLHPGFEQACSVQLNAHFGAVGAMKQQLLDGAPCDVLILTQALTDALTQSGQLLEGSSRPLGVVKTGVAVKAQAPWPSVATPEELRQALRQANGIYFPDPELATAGIHFMKVLRALGLAQELAPQLRPYPNGATAMKAMADCLDPQVMGCTQVTEILITPGVELVADLPVEFELATVYSAAVTRASLQPQMAAQWIERLTGIESAPVRLKAGFLPIP